MEKQLETLTQLGTDAVQSAITQYTQWYFVSSLCWLAVGAVSAIAAAMVWRKRKEWDGPGGWSQVAITARAAIISLVIIALSTLPLNVPTLLQPRAHAIHQLIKDAR